MLPALKPGAPRLADVLRSCLDSVLGLPNPLALRAMPKTVVLLADGLGAAALRARAGHARTLAPRLDKASMIESGFPTTTAAALASLTTGVEPGRHGLVGYTVFDAAHDRVVNQLSGWDARLDPSTWQRAETVFERATANGVPAFAVGAERYRDSGFTHAVLRGAEYRAGASMADRLEQARHLLDATDRALIYVYVSELDVVAHAEGWQSPAWTEQLEELDGAVRDFVAGLRRDEGLLVTADHGVLDVPEHGHIAVDAVPELVEGVRHIAGDPRCLQLHAEPDVDIEPLIGAWRRHESERAWVLARDEAIDAGWFGAVDAEVRPRIGDVIVAARKRIAYYDTRSATTHSRAMIGQHGSFTADEVLVPLLRFGAY